MTPYANLSGDSGVASYAIATDSITVRFVSGEAYVYTYSSAGQHTIERMKQLAKQGKGLSTFISTKVRNRYARKLT